MLDGGVVVFSAREGVEAQSETVWRQADKYGVPRLAFINKMDREGADFDGTFDEIRERLEANPVAIQIPVGAGPPHVQDAFRGVIDLVEMKFLTFDQEKQGAEVDRQPIPDDLADQAELWRERDARAAVRVQQRAGRAGAGRGAGPGRAGAPACCARRRCMQLIVPVLCGSALDHVGVQPLLGRGARIICPARRRAAGRRRQSEEARRQGNPQARARRAVLRAGVQDRRRQARRPALRARLLGRAQGQHAACSTRARTRRKTCRSSGTSRPTAASKCPSVAAGDIVGIIGLRHSITGDTLCDPQHPILLETIEFPETVISMAIEPESSAERKKLADALEMLKRQDPTFRAQENEETGQTLISGMGELHLEVIKHRLLRDFNLERARAQAARQLSRDGRAGRPKSSATCHRQQGGQIAVRRSADPHRAVSARRPRRGRRAGPRRRAARAVSVDRDRRPDRARARRRTVRLPADEAQDHGAWAARCTRPESNEIAFRYAAADAFNKGLQAAGTVLLEPIMKLQITTPEDHLGDFISDLQQRRADDHAHRRIAASNVVIEAEAPLANLFGYSSAMRGLSQGRATCSMEPAAYGPAPPDVAARLYVMAGCGVCRSWALLDFQAMPSVPR